jgi:hypothetical protein
METFFAHFGTPAAAVVYTDALHFVLLSRRFTL